MVLNRLEVLTVDATIIIGLLILLTFQSISSSFIETESASFMQNWQDVNHQLDQMDRKILECKLLESDPKTYEQIFLRDNTTSEYNPITGEYEQDIPLFNSIPEKLMIMLKEECYGNIIQRNDLLFVISSLDEMGYYLNYLEQYDSMGNIYNNLSYDEYDIDLPIRESDYLYLIITGPMYVNLINLMMLFPFLISAIIACINILRHPDDDHASKPAIVAMAIGFGFMLIGLWSIIAGFLEIYEPFFY